LFDAPVRSEEPNSPSEGNLLAEFKIDVRRLGCILLPVKIDGQECLFVFDTGASAPIIDVSLKSKLDGPKGKVKVATLGKSMMLDVFDAPEAFLGPFNLKEGGYVTCMDLTVFSQHIGRRICGIIGMSFLKRHVVQIDFDNERLLFLRASKDFDETWGVEFPITFGRKGIPLVKAKILGTVDTYFAVDAGCQGTGTLDKAVAEYVVLLEGVKAVDDEDLTLSGVTKARDLRIDSFSFGEFEYEKLIFSEANGSGLGLGFLSRHSVVFDFPNSRLYLKKGRDFNRADESAMAGLAIQRVEGEYIVQKVYEGDAAQEAGIEVGDIIVEIMGEASDSYEMWEIGKLLRSGDKREIAMTIKRGDERKNVTIVLRKKI